MAQIVRMPSVMANATDAVLSEWLTSVGETIAVGDPLAEIETDKAVVEYAAEVDGTIGRLLVEPGARVDVGHPIAVVLEAGEDPSLAWSDISPDPGATSAQPPTPEPSDTAEPIAPPVRQAAGQLQVGANPTGRLFATPIARRIAAQRRVDLALLTGTGPNGRIVRKDVESYRAGTTVPSVISDASSDHAGHRDVPLTGMRRAIAQRLTESKTTVPHFYVTAHVQVDRLLSLRQEINTGGPRKISVNDFVVKAVAAAMLEVPAANAIWNGESIRYFESVDLAVAVAVPTGLLTPVIRGVDRLGLNALSAQIARVADAARAGRLQQHQLEGGSFAVSNLGMYGVAEFSAIINPPQAGILAVSAAKPQPVVDDDGQLTVATVMSVTLSVDHRVIDGAVAAEWITALVAGLENPVRLLL
jgi:pyruvate dehydrogenase E2 component (dihydrolipoyllysine-residue acetyltransferase)